MGDTQTHDFKYNNLTGKIIGAAMNVHSALGNGFPEIIYHRSMIHELTFQGLSFESEISMPLFIEMLKSEAVELIFSLKEKYWLN